MVNGDPAADSIEMIELELAKDGKKFIEDLIVKNKREAESLARSLIASTDKVNQKRIAVDNVRREALGIEPVDDSPDYAYMNSTRKD